jgi:microcystin-dependent protein
MKKLCIIGCSLFFGLLPLSQAQAQEPFIGEIKWFGYTFCPRGWTEANGQLLPIAQNTALFSLYGTTYGGDGRTTFALPDMRGRVSVHTGQGPGLSNYILGQSGGTETETLSAQQIPAHKHGINVSPGDGVYSDGANGVLASAVATKKNTDVYIYDGPGTAGQQLAADAMSDTGGGQSHNNRQPFVTLRACVALVGIYPSRN